VQQADGFAADLPPSYIAVMSNMTDSVAGPFLAPPALCVFPRTISNLPAESQQAFSGTLVALMVFLA